MPFTQPPGFISPSAFPFVNGLFNDAPISGVPYFLGVTANDVISTTKTVLPSRKTATGDTIVIFIGENGGASLATSCTDTQGNIYSLTQTDNGAKVQQQFTCVNSVSVSQSDTITITFAGNTGGSRHAIAIGCPSQTTWLIPDQIANFAFSTTVSAVLSTAVTSQANEIVLAAMEFSTSGGVMNWPSPWTPLYTFIGSGGDTASVAWASVPSRKAVTASVNLPATANIGIMISTFTPETRIAPNQPFPLMPPGNISPGSWQNTILPRSFNALTDIHDAGSTVNNLVTSLSGIAVESMVNPASTVVISSMSGSLSELISGATSTVTNASASGIIQELINGSSSAISVASVFGSLSELMIVPTATVTDSAPTGSSSIIVQSVVADNLVATINGSLSELMSGVTVNISSASQPGSVTLIAQGDTAQVLVDPVSGESYIAFYLTGMPATVNVLSEPGTSEVIHSYLGIPAVVTNESLAGTLEILAVPGVAHWYGRLIMNN